MENQVDKTSANRQHASSELEGAELASGGPLQLQTAENPNVIAQRKLQAAVNESAQVQQLKTLQRVASESPQVQQAMQLQAAANEQPVQRMGGEANKTGLPDQLKSGIESLSGMSMDDVKVHYNSDKPAQLQALAYAQGTDIHIAPGQEQHLPHEAWHVVQQAQGRVQPTKQLKGKTPINDDSGLEHEADVMGAKAMQLKVGGDASLQEIGTQSQASAQRKITANTNAPVQRVTAQIRASTLKNGMINQISIVGRPESPHSGTMGDHSTAFTTMQSGIETQFSGRTLRDASLVLSDLAHELLDLPGWKLRNNLPEKHRQKLETAYENLGRCTKYFRKWRKEGKKYMRYLEEDMKNQKEEQYYEEQIFNEEDELYGNEEDNQVDNSELKDEEIMDDNSSNFDDNSDEIVMGDVEKKEDEMIVVDELEESDYDYYSGNDVSWLQWGVEMYMEVRELIPLSTINTKAVNAVLAGKGKGENATPLVKYATGSEFVDDNTLMQSILSLFDARSAAVVAEISDQNLMNKVAPGMSVEMAADNRILMMIDQHVLTIRALHPEVFNRLAEMDKITDLEKLLWEAVKSKRKDNSVSMQSKYSVKDKGKSTRAEKSTYVAAHILVDKNDYVEDVKIEGRPKSPFSNTMGAHTTAFIVYKDRLYNQLRGKSVVEAAQVLINMMDEAKFHAAEAMEVFVTDSKQLSLLAANLLNLNFWKGELSQLNSIDQEEDQVDLSSWKRVIELQEAVIALLEVMNATPGGTLDVANTNGKREGAHRAVLLDENADRDQTRRAILGMLDVSGLEGYMQSMESNVKDNKGQLDEARSEYWKQNKGSHKVTTMPTAKNEFYHGFYVIVKHHFKLIEEAYPGALKTAGLDTTDDLELLQELLQELLHYVKVDKKVFANVLTEDDEDA